MIAFKLIDQELILGGSFRFNSPKGNDSFQTLDLVCVMWEAVRVSIPLRVMIAFKLQWFVYKPIDYIKFQFP